MSRAGKTVIFIALFWHAVTVAFVATGKLELALLGMFASFLFLVGVVISLFLIFRQWRQNRWRAIFPFAVCAIAVITVPPMAKVGRHAVFLWALSSYEAIVHRIESGAIPVDAELRPIPDAEAAKARLLPAVLAQRDLNGTLIVEFVTGCAVGHFGFLYCSSDKIEKGSRSDSRWHGGQRFKAKWFNVAN